MAARADIRQVIDSILLVPKEPKGVVEWIETTQGNRRQTYPLLVDGEISDATLTIICYPRERVLKFRLVLSYGRAVWRVDYAFDEDHQNPFNKPENLPIGKIVDPHYHSWHDNRRFATAFTLPFKLYNANVLPANVRTFENTFRWFCGQTNIVVPASGIPELPRSDRLL